MNEHGIDDLMHFGEEAVASGKLKSFRLSIEAYPYPDSPDVIEHRDVEVSLTRSGQWGSKIIALGLDCWRDDAKREAFIARALTVAQAYADGES